MLTSFPDIPLRTQNLKGTLLAIGSMACFQLTAALSVPLLISVGPSASAGLRLVGAAAFLWIIAPPLRQSYTHRTVALAGVLGIASCGMTVFFAEAIARIPLGIATAVEFIGPLGIAAVLSLNLLEIGWTALAALGVLLLTLTEGGWSEDPIGLCFAGSGGLCWGAYILLTKRVGQAFSGLHGLTISLTVAALLAAPFCTWQLKPTATVWTIGASICLGIIIPVIPYGLEMMAMRRLNTRTFGILMSGDPAISTIAGCLILQQDPTAQKLLGIACVVLASALTTITAGHRDADS